MAEEMKRNAEAEKVGSILEVVAEKIPVIIRGVMESIFSESAGREMGKAVGAFYSELKAKGFPEEIAIEMTKDYMKSFTNFGQILKELKH